jgi:hypothetical protein
VSSTPPPSENFASGGRDVRRRAWRQHSCGPPAKRWVAQPSEGRLLTLAKDLPPAARIVVLVVNTLEHRVAGVCATIQQTSNDLQGLVKHRPHLSWFVWLIVIII